MRKILARLSGLAGLAATLAGWAPSAQAEEGPGDPPLTETIAVETAVVEPTISPEAPHKAPLCQFGIGMAGGAYNGERDWDRVGQQPWAPTFSPVFAANCGRNQKGAFRPWIGVESAPWYVNFYNEQRAFRQFVTASAGVLVGSDHVLFGVHASAGFPSLGAGVGAMFRPEGTLGAIDLRVSGIWVEGPGLQAMAIYVVAPRQKKLRGRNR